MSKPTKSGAGQQAADADAIEAQAASPGNGDPGVRAEAFGVEFPVGAGDILASKEYEDRVVVVSRDGRKLSQPKRAAK